MSLDLSVAIEAAARDHYDSERMNALTDALVGPEWDAVWPELKHAWRADALPYVAAAAPLIEAQVRSQVAAEIRACIVAEPEWMHVTDWRDGMETAEDIARGTP